VLVDIAAAGALTCLAVYAPLDPPGPAHPGPAWAAWVVGAAVGLPLLLRRRWSVPVLVWVVLVASAATLLGVVGAGVVWVVFAPAAVASYTAANLTGRTVVAVAVLVVGLGAAAASVPAFYWIHRPAERSASVSEAGSDRDAGTAHRVRRRPERRPARRRRVPSRRRHPPRRAGSRLVTAPTPDIRVLLVDDHALIRESFHALLDAEPGFRPVGAAGTGVDLVTAIRVVAAVEALLASRVTRRFIAAFARRGRPTAVPADLPGITEREREVLTLIARGLSNTEIARDLYVTLGTVKTHIGRLLSKLDARDRAQLVIAAYEAGLVTAGR
jgi:DNA-binding NarL/FixJ family response regulator